MQDVVFFLVASGIFGAICALAITPLRQDWTTIIMPRFFGGRSRVRQRSNLEGEWHQVWSVDDYGNGPISTESPATITQSTSGITGTFHHDGMEYRIRGSTEIDGYLRGSWSDVMDGATYHGVFQLRIEPHTRRLIGKWIGFSRTGAMRTGSWTWTRASNG